VGHISCLKLYLPAADELGEEERMFQLVRRKRPETPTQRARTVVETVTSREQFLSKALITLLSINVFMVATVVSFCTFTFWYPAP